MKRLHPSYSIGRWTAVTAILAACLILPLSPAGAGVASGPGVPPHPAAAENPPRPTALPPGPAGSGDDSSGFPAEDPVDVPAEDSIHSPEGGSIGVPQGDSSGIPAGGSADVPADGSADVPAHGPADVPAYSSADVPADGGEGDHASNGTGSPEEKPRGPRVALTFDDGPHGTVTPEILDELQMRGAKATFFIVGSRVLEHPDIIRRMNEEGHEIGNHSWDHSRLTDLTPRQIFWQVERTQRAVQLAAGRRPAVMRPPYGAYDDSVLRVLQASGMPAVLWSVDTRDWESRDAEMVAAAAMEAQDGDIILFHDLYDSTARAVGPILDHLTERGFTFVTVSEMLGLESGGENTRSHRGTPSRNLHPHHRPDTHTGQLPGAVEPLHPTGRVFRSGADVLDRPGGPEGLNASTAAAVPEYAESPEIRITGASLQR